MEEDSEKLDCICNEVKDMKHFHGVNCGHPPIYHYGHIDYIVEG